MNCCFQDLRRGYPPDFFDFIVIDECHRGGANDESTWRAILEYFKSAVQLGLTATPKLTDNVDTREMPYGKYKGCLIADLPGPYLNWFARKGFPPGEIGLLLALMQELDHNGLSLMLAPLRKRV